MSKMTSFSLFILLNVMVHQYHCGENLWKKFETNYLESKGGLVCYRTVTLQLFENLKQVVDVAYVESAENEFKSKVKRQLNFPSFFHNENEMNEDSLNQKIKEAESVAIKELSKIREWLLYKCSDEKQKQIMKFTKIFKEGKANCGDRRYLNTAIWWLEGTCGPLVKKEKSRENTITAPWKTGITSMEYTNP